jgi:redox-sensitive bicupin YhaK (pirin superfamily)
VITIRPSNERLRTQLAWLDSRHSFSFGEHYDPRFMGFRALRVINEDRVAPGQGFGTHPHRDMEILSYVLEGALRHEDSMGTGAVIKPGDLQRLTAGTGVLHSEANASDTEPVHFLQIWLLPERPRLPPGYEQRTYPFQSRRGRLTLIGSRDGREGSVTIHQDVRVYSAVLTPGDGAVHALKEGRHAWVQVARGAVQLNGGFLKAGDGASVSDESSLELAVTLEAEASCDALVFDLA